MKKSTFVATILETIGGILFAFGMCLTMVGGQMIIGIVAGIVRLVRQVIPFCQPQRRSI